MSGKKYIIPEFNYKKNCDKVEKFKKFKTILVKKYSFLTW